jgi:hypothetical protein
MFPPLVEALKTYITETTIPKDMKTETLLEFLEDPYDGDFSRQAISHLFIQRMKALGYSAQGSRWAVLSMKTF